MKERMREFHKEYYVLCRWRQVEDFLQRRALKEVIHECDRVSLP